MESRVRCKRPKTEPQCIKHCTDDKGNLISPNTLESLKTLKRAGQIRQHEGILSLMVETSDDEIPEGEFYHRKCRSVFTLKRDLENIAARDRKKDDYELEEKESEGRRTSIRQVSTPNISRVFEQEGIFCQRKEKYLKGSRSTESLTQARQLRVDNNVRKAAEAKQDSRMITILTRELVAAEAHYHRSCYRQYTKTGETATSIEPDESDDDYAKAEACAFSRLCDYIRSDRIKSSSGAFTTELKTEEVDDLNGCLNPRPLHIYEGSLKLNLEMFCT